MIEISTEPIDPGQAVDSVLTTAAGAVVTFDGTVRSHSQGRAVSYLIYEAYEPMALEELHKISRTARTRWPVEKVAIVHRTGRLEIGESSVFIAVSAAHRAPAFEACRYIIDQLKVTVPIWKKEHFTDGAVWVEPYSGG